MGETATNVASPLTPAEARACFPALERMTYFATNGHGILSQQTRDAIADGADLLMRRGYAGAARLDQAVETARGQVATLLGAGNDEIAFVRNTGEGLCLVADLIPWQAGDEVLSFSGEYRSIVHAFQGVAHRGVDVRVAKIDELRRVTPDMIANELRDNTRAVAVSWVRYDNGARADLEAIGALLHDAGVLFIVDGIQGAGVMATDLQAAKVSFFCAGAHKWLLGLSGSGILYMRRELIPDLVHTHLGVTSMEDEDLRHGPGDPYTVCPVLKARRVEEGSRNALGIAALSESLKLYERIGADAVKAQVKAVTDRLCEGFLEAGGRVLSPRMTDEWSGILLLEPPPGVDVDQLLQRLLQERIILGTREGALWGAVHYYNSLEDAEKLLSFL